MSETMEVAMPERRLRFEPSIARNIGGGVGARSAMAEPSLVSTAVFNAIVAFSVVCAPSFVSAAAPAEAPLAFRVGTANDDARARVRAATQDLVGKLKAKGMPVAALADVLDVERKTVYSWIDDGIEAKAANYERLNLVHDLLAGEPDGSLRFFQRFWERKIPGGPSLKEALMAPEIDRESVRAALDALRPAVQRSMQADAERKASAVEKSAASTLTIHLVAGRQG